MDRTPVTSSAFKSVGYDPATQTLEIEYHSGKVYQHAGVPPEKHAALMGAESKGKHLNVHIRPHHPATLVPPAGKEVSATHA